MTTPKIDMNASVAKNLNIIYGGDNNINTPQEAELAESFLKFVRPKASGDELRIRGLKQALDNYYAIGESAVLAHYAKTAYYYITDKGSKLYTKLQNYINKDSYNILAHKE